MEIILEKKRQTHSSLISSFEVGTTANAERMVGNMITITAGLVDVYTKSEVDAKINSGGGGFGTYTDSNYTFENPLVVNNAIVPLIIDGMGSTTEKRFLPGGFELYDTSEGEIKVKNVGDTMTIRLNFKARTLVLGDFDIEITINDENPVIIGSKTLQMVKGINVEQSFSETISLYGLETFIVSGAKIRINSTNDELNLSIYDAQIFIKTT